MNFPSQSEMADGYISDVPTQYSNGNSEISNDLVESTRILEKHFKDKYMILRSAYDKRIRKLTEVVKEACSEVLADELIVEMKHDKASSSFIPAYLAETIERHLDGEREKFIHQMMSKVSALEAELTKSLQKNDAQNRMIKASQQSLEQGKKSEKSYHAIKEAMLSMESQYKQQLDEANKLIVELKDRNSMLEKSHKDMEIKVKKAEAYAEDITNECQRLSNVNREKDHEINVLEQSFEHSSRELAIIEGMDKQERLIKKNMQEQLATISNQKNELLAEVQELRGKFRTTSDELQRVKVQLKTKTEEEQASQQKISTLMNQVETILAQEANESNAAIAAVHEKMKIFRNKMTTELQREKRLSVALQEELNKFKQLHDDTVREHRRLVENESQIRDKIFNEQKISSTLQMELQDTQKVITELKLKISEIEARAKQAEDKLVEKEKSKAAEMELLEQKAFIKAKKEYEEETKLIEQKTSAYRLHYENELGKMQNQLRHSYTFGSMTDFANTSESSFKQIIDKWAEDKSKLKEQHAMELEQLRSKITSDFNDRVKLLQVRLMEASSNIEKLKDMVQESRAVNQNQQSVIEQLNSRLWLLQKVHQQELEIVQNEQDEKMHKSTHLTDAYTDAPSINQSQYSVDGESYSYAANSNPIQRGEHSSLLSVALTQANRSPSRSMNKTTENTITSERLSRTGSVQSIDSISDVRTRSIAKSHASERMEKSSMRSAHSLKSQKSVKLNDDLNRVESPGNIPASLIVTSALEEAREAKLRAAHLESEIDKLQEELISMKKKQEQEISRQETAVKVAIEQEKIDDNSTIDSAFMSNVGDSIAVSLHAVNNTKEAGTSVGFSDHHKSFHDASISAVNESFSNSYYKKQMEDTLQHQLELTSIANNELMLERDRLVKSRKREVQLYQLLTVIDKTYKTQIHLLRQELAKLKGEAEDFTPASAIVIRKIVYGLSLKFTEIFDNYKRKQEKQLYNMRITLGTAHATEISLLESRFIEQIQEQSKKHALELENMHADVIGKAEKIINMNNAYAHNTDFIESTHIKLNETKNTSSNKSVNNSADNMSVKTLKYSEVSDSIPAYESLTKGLIEALIAYDILTSSSASEIVSIAVTHQEPSFAATAAAKSLLSGQLELFLSAVRSAAIVDGSHGMQDSYSFLTYSYPNSVHQSPARDTVHSGEGKDNGSKAELLSQFTSSIASDSLR